MYTNSIKRFKVVRIILLIESILLLLWWPFSHFFLSEWYHTILGFSVGTYPQPMVIVIGTCGLCIVAFTFLAAINPKKNKDIVIGLVITAYVLACMYFYLVINGLFPIMEIINLFICLFSGTLILAIYPWKKEKEA